MIVFAVKMSMEIILIPARDNCQLLDIIQKKSIIRDNEIYKFSDV
jgi:hypothetical protein